MKRSLYTFAAAAVLAVTVSAAAHAADVGFSVSIGDRYRGTSLYFSNQPRTYLIPETRVYYVRNQDLDLYRYGSYWYYVEDGYWYRAASWRGPFYRVRYTTVPRSVLYVPVRYRHHWRTGYNSMADWERRERWDRGRHRGHYRDWERHDRYDRNDNDRYDNDRGYDRNYDRDRDYDRGGYRNNGQ